MFANDFLALTVKVVFHSFLFSVFFFNNFFLNRLVLMGSLFLQLSLLLNKIQ